MVNNIKQKVLIVPVWSSRTKETGIYNLNTDGNYNRTYGTVKQFPLVEFTICVPEKAILPNDICNYIVAPYPSNPAETRMSYELANFVLSIADKYDYIIAYPQQVAYIIYKAYKDKLIYHADVSVTPDGTPHFFTQEMVMIDDYLLNECERCYVTTPAQQAQYPKAKLFRYWDHFRKHNEVIFWPFRLTDSVYCYEQIVPIFDKLAQEGQVILYTDPTNSKLWDDKPFTKISANHDLFIALISSPDIIVPYPVDCSIATHFAFYEFIKYKTKVLTIKPKYDIHFTKEDLENIHFYEIDEFYKILRK